MIGYGCVSGFCFVWWQELVRRQEDHPQGDQQLAASSMQASTEQRGRTCFLFSRPPSDKKKSPSSPLLSSRTTLPLLSSPLAQLYHNRPAVYLHCTGVSPASFSPTVCVSCNHQPPTTHQEQKQRILDKYGGSEHLDVPDARLLVGQTESYVEYDRTGRVVKGAPKVRVWVSVSLL